jgi:flagellar biosynthesis protein FlhF
MNTIHFRARNAADALGQIRSRLGADAVVLSVAQVPAQGLGRLWRKPQLEVLAGLPDDGGTHPVGDAESNPGGGARGFAAAANPAMAYARQDWNRDSRISSATENDIGKDFFESSDSGPAKLGGEWRSAALLHQMGLLPLHVEKVLERARTASGGGPPSSYTEEIALVQSTLASYWRVPPRVNDLEPQLHVFIGPPGSGKTTALCKWMAKTVLTEGRRARAWRLDSRAANFAGLLDLYGEILGVPIEREWRPDPGRTAFDVGFVDLPGFHAGDPAAVRQMRGRLEALPGAHVHLVLNAAYDASVILAQARAFAALPAADIVFTHLDEEKRIGKLWNVLLGTNLAVRHLSGGQNIPGNFSPATPNSLFPANFKMNTPGLLVVGAARRLGRRLAPNVRRLTVE